MLDLEVICLTPENYPTIEDMLSRVEEWINDTKRSDDLKKILVSKAQDKIRKYYDQISENIYLMINDDSIAEQVN